MLNLPQPMLISLKRLPPISSTTSSAPITLPTSNMNQVRTINLQSKGTANQLVPTPVLLSKTVSTGTQNTIALDNSASPSETLISTTRKETKKRQFSSTQWCLLGTTFYVLLQPFSGQSSNANVKSLMQSAVSQISQSLGASENTTIPAPSSPILSLFWNSGDRIDVYNLPGSSMTYYQLSLAVNLTNNYMSQNQYTAVGVQLINGTANIGRLQIV